MQRTASLLAIALAANMGCSQNGGETEGHSGSADRPLVIDATVVACPALPSADGAPYRDCLLTLKFRPKRVISGTLPEGPTVLVTTWIFRNRIPQPGSKLATGAEVRLTLETFDDYRDRFATTMRIDETDDFGSPEYWVQSLAILKPGRQGAEASTPVYGTPTEQLQPANRRLVEQETSFVAGENGFYFAMLSREVYRKDFWILPPSEWGAARVILEFHQELASKSIPLLVVIVPRANSVFPDFALGEAYNLKTDSPPNAAVEDMCIHLRGSGVHVLNLTTHLFDRRFVTAANSKRYPAYLPNDSHWAPYGIRVAADTVTKYLAEHKLLPETIEIISSPETKNVQISHRGDYGRLFEAERIEPPIHQTIAYSVRPAPPGPKPEFLVQLLGDSQSRIFAKHNASFADHLTARIGAKWNVIAPNAGVTTARKMFARSGNLDKTDLVVWQFSEDFLPLHHMWRRVPIDHDHILKFWNMEVLELSSGNAAASAEPLFEQTVWEDLVGIRVRNAGEICWDKVQIGKGAHLGGRVRVGPAESSVARRAQVTFHILADGNELYQTALVPRRDRNNYSDPFSVPLEESTATKISLIVRISAGVPPKSIAWIGPELIHSRLGP